MDGEQARAGARRWRRRGATLVAAVALAGLASPAAADPPPSPLPWQRSYVSEAPVSNDQLVLNILNDCHDDLERGVRDNGAAGVPRIAVLGDSVESQTRPPALADPAYRWMYATHCGEKFGTAVDSGRVADAVATHPDVLVVALGSNDMSDNWQVSPGNLGSALTNLGRVLDASESVPCRVLVNLPRVTPTFAPNDGPAWQYLTGQINAAIDGAQGRHGVHVADWATRVAPNWPAYLQDGLHLTGAGVNARVNLAIEAARQCQPPDSPSGVGAVAANGTATVWWNPLPDAEKVTSYTVTSSDGRTVTTTAPTVNVPGLTNGAAYGFTVAATNASGTGPASAWTPAVTPSAAGARFHAVSPVRVLDTRSGLGGKAGAFGPGESFRLPLTGVVPNGASAVVLNVTATGQTNDTFVTAWPSGQGRPLASNLNPHPGVDAVPAMVTTRLGSDGAVLLYNATGQVHLIADVVGWYGAAGDPSGSLYAPLSPGPTRLLDTRTGLGGKATPFGRQETYRLPIPQLPGDATAAVLNITSVDTTAAGHVTVWPDGQARPVASSLNPQPGLTRANVTVAKVGTSGAVDIYNNSASTALLVDLLGYETADGAAHGGSLYYPVTPERAYDTRFGTGGVAGPIGNGADLRLGFLGHGAVPAGGVTAVDANVTVVSPSSGGHTTVWPTGVRPVASTLNYQPGETVANRDPVALGGGGALFWSAAGSIQYVVDVAGWWGPPL